MGALDFGRHGGVDRRARRWFLPLKNGVVGIRGRNRPVVGRDIGLRGLRRRRRGSFLLDVEVGCLDLLWGPRRNPGGFLQINVDEGESVPDVLRI